VAVLQIIGDRAGAGKTGLASVLLTRGIAQEKKVGYYKPFSRSPDNDPDHDFIYYRHLLGPGDASEAPKPLLIPDRPGADSAALLSQNIRRRIRAAANKLNAANDLVVVDGPDLYAPNGQASPLASEVASVLDSRVLLLFRYVKGLTAATVANAAEPLRRRMAGVIINGVTRYRLGQVSQGLVEELRAQFFPALGALPEDRAMLSVTVQQIADHLGGTWVEEPVNADDYVDRFLIGANIMDAGLNYFGRFEREAVITRGGRPDIQMASMETPATRCLVLTGGEEPIDYVKAEASNRAIPMILVQTDTLATAEALSGLLEQSNIYSRQKIERLAELMGQNLDLAVLDSALG